MYAYVCGVISHLGDIIGRWLAFARVIAAI